MPAPGLHLPLAFWIDLEYLSVGEAALLFALLAAPVVLLGVRSLAGLGPVRRWVAIGLRLLVLLTIVLILGGARWQRQHKNVEVLVLRDISESTALYRNHPGANLQEAIDDYLRSASQETHKPSKDDRIGVISFAGEPRIDSMPHTSLVLDSRAIRENTQGTDIASAIQLALASFQRGAMRRLLLISDGNQTAGDLETSLAAAVSQRVPIDVVKLSYAVQNEVLIERLSAPSWRRESDAFDVFVSLLSTNREAVGGTLTLLEEGQPIERRRITIEPATVDAGGRLEARKHVERVRVPALKSRGVRRFKATFEPDAVNHRAALASGLVRAGDTLLQNNSASAFTFVHGQGRVLYVDNTADQAGRTLLETLQREGINVTPAGIEQLSDSLVALQDYDAIVLNNVPRHGLSSRHDEALASYVHDFGGGLVMIGGPDSLGAGGWQGSKVERVMPVEFDIPAQRQLPKGALVLIVHSCEMPNGIGNYWGEQCAIKAVETLSAQDEVGVISFDWNNQGNGGLNGCVWNLPLQPKGDGAGAIAAIKKMAPGDMPTFDDCLNLAIHGTGPGRPSLRNSNAAQKHIIIISDGDPQLVKQQQIFADLAAGKITVSTVGVYPHGGAVPPTLKRISDMTKGRYYGPIDRNPGQLPQIFIKEATVVRRTLVQESASPPINVAVAPHTSDIMKGLAGPPPVRGLVLCQKKSDPRVEMPLVATLDGKKIDPLFAHWQAGLGKTAVFASGGSGGWDQPWVQQYGGNYGKFWSQLVRGVSRPPMSTDFVVTTERRGDKAVVTVEAANKEQGFASFLRVQGTVVDPDRRQQEIRLLQTAPGTYQAEFPASAEGNYVVALRYAGANKQEGWLASGLAVNDSPEVRELKSNDQVLEEIARRTNGRVLPAFAPEEANLFSRENLTISSSPLPVWDILIPILLGLILLDVAARRIAWDWNAIRATVAKKVREFTLPRPVEAKPTLDALKRVRDEVAETRFKTEVTPVPPPDRSKKFEAGAGVEGDITQVVGGATPLPKAAPPPADKPAGHTGSLLEAKRRAQEKIRKKQEGEQ